MKRFLGTLFSLMLLGNLAVAIAPASAGTLSWTTETIPSESDHFLEPGSNVVDIAVYDGNIIFAAGGSTILYKSTTGGETWSTIDTDNDTDLIVVAPDDQDILVYADTVLSVVWVSTNGGSTWVSLGTPDGLDIIKDITISPESAGIHYIAVAGEDTGPVAEVWTYNIGATVPAWKEISAISGGGFIGDINSSAVAVAYSPNFPVDQVLLVVTSKLNETATDDHVYLQIFSENTDTWNSMAGFDDYPVDIVNGLTGMTSVIAGSIALDPEYLGSDYSMHLAFVGLTVAGDTAAVEASGIYRLQYDKVAALKKEKQIHSIAFNGTDLVFGQYDGNRTYRYRNRFDTTIILPTTSANRPGGENKTIVAWAGDDVIAGTSGNGSAFAVSTDVGKTFTDISLDDAGIDISDFAVAFDDTTVYATDKESDKLYKSTNAGVSWTKLTNPSGATEPQLVAVAPDDAGIVAIVADDNEVYISDDGGANWDSPGTPDGLDIIKDITVSPESAGTHYIAVAGEDTGPVAEVWTYNFGAATPAWKEISAISGGGFNGNTNSSAVAVAYSPNFPGDQVLVAVTSKLNETTTDDHVYVQIFNENPDEWNSTGGFDGYPVDIVDGLTGMTSITSGSITLDPEYLGSDESMRVAFVGLTIAGDADAQATSGIYRQDDDNVTALKTGKQIHSIAYDGTNLVAGANDNTIVWRCASPYNSDPKPTIYTNSYLKSPGGENKVVIDWVGSDVVAGTSGKNSAFAVSKDNCRSFNDISLIDTALTTLEDVAVSADGSKIYLATDDGADLSLWRWASSWKRVLLLEGETDYFIRIAPDDSDVVYLAKTGDRMFFCTTDGGTTTWQSRASRYVIQDLAVESANVAYVAVYGAMTVSKSTNNGFTWSTAKYTWLASDDMLTPSGVTEPQLVAVAPDNADIVAIVADDNEVYITFNGGLTWGSLDTPDTPGKPGNYVDLINDIAISPESGGSYYIAVACEDTGGEVWSWEYGSTTPQWEDIFADGDGELQAQGPNSTAAAIAFSPNFPSDQVLLVVTELHDESTSNDNVYLEIYSYNTEEWNDSSNFDGYPAVIATDDGITDLTSGSITLDPEYLGSDESMRLAFVGLTVAGDADAQATSGVYRMDDDTQEELKADVPIHSIAYDGTNLVAGAYDNTIVWHSSDPLAPTPTISSSLNPPGGENKVVVDWVGSDVMAGTSGNNSAFATSSDNGTTFTDISLDDTDTDISDFAFASDNITAYATDKESDKLYKTTNGGSTWSAARDTFPGIGATIVSVGEDKLLVGSADGYVSYSTDGNSSWTKLDQQIETGALLTQVTASGLASGDYIYAASSKADTKVLRWQVGVSTNWTDMNAPTASSYGAYGIALKDGVLYVANSDTTANSEVLRTLNPNADTVTWSTLASPGQTFICSPSALKVSDGSAKLWAIDTTGAALFSYTDTLPDIATDVEIDIKPGSYPNSINPDSKGVIPVAILTTPDFDAASVDPATVRFGPDEASPVHYALEDVDNDGDNDVVVQFKTQDTGIAAGDTEATLTAKTTDGTDIIGTDSVRTVPPKGKKSN